MRDPKRIPKILKELETFWLTNPDLRLCQIVINWGYYYLEDEHFIEILKKHGDEELAPRTNSQSD